MDDSELENPTLVLKLSAILCLPWNRDLRDELIAAENIQKLRGKPVQIVTSNSSESSWITKNLSDSQEAFSS